MPTAWCRHCDAAIASVKHVQTCMPKLTASQELESLLERVAEGSVSPKQGTAIIARFIVQTVAACKQHHPEGHCPVCDTLLVKT